MLCLCLQLHSGILIPEVCKRIFKRHAFHIQYKGSGFRFPCFVSENPPQQIPSNGCCSPVDHIDMKSLFEFLLKEIVDLKKTSVLFYIVTCCCGDFQRFPGEGVHGDFIHRKRTCHFHPNWRNVPGWRRFCGSRTGSGSSSSVSVAWHPCVRGSRSLKELLLGLKPQLFVFININVHSQHTNCFCHNKRQGSKIKRPAVTVLVLFILIPLVTRIACIAGDVDNNSYYVT